MIFECSGPVLLVVPKMFSLLSPIARDETHRRLHPKDPCGGGEPRLRMLQRLLREQVREIVRRFRPLREELCLFLQDVRCVEPVGKDEALCT